MIDFIEKRGPMLIALVTVSLLFYFREWMVARAVAKDVDFGNLYSAVLNWSAIQTGFLFGIFGFVAGKNDGFIAAVRNTIEMRQFSRYMRTAMALGFGVTLGSIPLMVVNFSIVPDSMTRYLIFCGWAFISIWSFLSFGRVAYVFGILVRPKDKERFPG